VKSHVPLPIPMCDMDPTDPIVTLPARERGSCGGS
jgi:hypothetical protein